MRLRLGLGAAFLLTAACSSNAADNAAPAAATAAAAASTQAAGAARHAASGLEVIPLTVEHDQGLHTFKVEIARTNAEQAQGLMFRASLAPDEGMIFPMQPPRQAAFWMRNTVIPLDIIFIGIDGRISNMWENTVPYSEEPLPSTGLAKGVLEIPGGRARQLGLAVGDRVSW